MHLGEKAALEKLSQMYNQQAVAHDKADKTEESCCSPFCMIKQNFESTKYLLTLLPSCTAVLKYYRPSLKGGEWKQRNGFG